MFCKNCGNEIKEKDEFCSKCGTPITEKNDSAEVSKEEKVDKNGMAIAGFVCSFFIPILGWVFGGIGMARANKRNGKGMGFSIAAIAIATVMFFINLTILN